MKKMFFLVLALAATHISIAQMDVPPSGGNPRAKITEEVGITDITLKYSRPDVNGREGKIWGTLVTYGFSTTNFTSGKNNSPWRAGANENTTISFEHDVKVEGKPVKAGTYGLHMAVWADSVVLILSTQTNAWGSFYYDDREDVLRTTVKPTATEKSTEWLKYEFIEHKEKSCTIAMLWEKWMIPFKIEVDVENIVIAGLREQVKSQKGFNSNNMLQAAQYCLNKNINLEEALTWSIRAINGFQGQKSFITLRNLGVAYEKLNRLAQADSVMAEALTIATANQYNVYGRALIAQKRTDKAMETFMASQKKYGDVFAVNTGLMYGYSATKDFAKAMAAAEKAMAQAPNEAAKKQIEPLLQKLKEGKDIN
jgi:Tfp pilus assembly protein PilF